MYDTLAYYYYHTNTIQYTIFSQLSCCTLTHLASQWVTGYTYAQMKRRLGPTILAQKLQKSLHLCPLSRLILVKESKHFRVHVVSSQFRDALEILGYFKESYNLRVLQQRTHLELLKILHTLRLGEYPLQLVECRNRRMPTENLYKLDCSLVKLLPVDPKINILQAQVAATPPGGI